MFLESFTRLLETSCKSWEDAQRVQVNHAWGESGAKAFGVSGAPTSDALAPLVRSRSSGQRGQYRSTRAPEFPNAALADEARRATAIETPASSRYTRRHSDMLQGGWRPGTDLGALPRVRRHFRILPSPGVQMRSTARNVLLSVGSTVASFVAVDVLLLAVHGPVRVV